MSATTSPVKINEERRKRVFLGALPSDFLRPNNSLSNHNSNHQTDLDQQTALALQNELAGAYSTASSLIQNPVGRLNITVVQAKLVKNYGLVTKMDPYVRLRVGHCVYETHTDPSGGKFPRWNKEVFCLLPQGVTSIYLEIYDECSFTMDELIAWAKIPIPSSVMKGETHEDWFPLSGKQGEDKEGMINLVLSYTNTPMPAGQYMMPPGAPVMMLPRTGGSILGMGTGYAPAQVYVQQPPVNPAVPLQQPLPPVQLSETDLKQIQEMFPNMDGDVVKSVYEVNRGNKDATVNSLLQMSE
ncbi:hypothetical protein M8J77_024048 [Diaphorina citri]|nr:hypothetical protein M8J77_024048 [Diaphorina citri]